MIELLTGLSLLVAILALGFSLRHSGRILALEQETSRRETKMLALEETSGDRNDLMLKLSHAGWEMQAQQYIDSAWREFDTIALQLHEDESKGEILSKVYISARQRLLNAYDATCQAYIDEKIDRERFRRAQKRNIDRLFDNIEDYPELEGRNTDYRALATVYDEWRGPA